MGTADVKLEALEEDRFFVCCLENVDLCDQVPYGQGWEGVSIHSQPGNDTIDIDISSACVDKPINGLAYLWLETPCSGEAACPLYSNDQFRLPVAPFKLDISYP